MATIDTSFSGMPAWMKPQDDAASESFLSAFTRAQAIKQQQNSPLYLAQVAEAQKRVQQMGFEMQSEQIGLEAKKYQMEDMIAGRQSEAEIASQMAKVKDWSDPGELSKVDAIFAKRPTKAGKAMVDEAAIRHKEAVQAKDRSELMQARREATAAKFETDVMKAGVTLEAKKSAAELAEAKLEAQKSKLTSQQTEREDYAKLKEQKNSLDILVKSNPTNAGLRKMQREVDSKLEAFGLEHKGGLTATLQYDDQGRPIINLGEGKATVGTQTQIQTELANIKNSVVQIDAARNMLREKDVGVSGMIWDDVVNKWVSQVAPEAGDPTVAANRVQLQKSVDSYLESQQARGRLSASERAMVRDALVTRRAGESLPRAQGVLDAMARVQKFEAISRAKTGQQPLQPWMFQGLSQTEIGQLRKEGVITPAESIEWGLKAPRR